MSFEDSTQKRYWIFAEDELKQIRSDVNDRATAEAQARLIEKNEQTVKPLSVAEEEKLGRHYGGLIVKLCREMRFPSELAAAAVTFFKRFYVYNSVMDLNPNGRFCGACIYLASKATEHHVNLEMLAKAVKAKPKSILKLEVSLLEGVKFHLKMFFPFQPLKGFIEQLQAMEMQEQHAAPLNWDLMKEKTPRLLMQSLHTDVSLLYPPPQIALAALLFIAKENDQGAVEPLLRKVLLEETREHRVNELLTICQRIQEHFKADSHEVQVSPQDLAEIDRRAIKSRDPLRDPTTAEYKAMQKKMIDERHARRVKKMTEAS